jgi:hypothetical protein
MAGGSRLYVYGLWDPRVEELFYIGQTRNFRDRRQAHFAQLSLLPKLRRMESIVNDGQRPEMRIIEDVDSFSPEAKWIEEYYISNALKVGAPLTNVVTKRVR